jgi:hypothetical protein
MPSAGVPLHPTRLRIMVSTTEKQDLVIVKAPFYQSYTALGAFFAWL